MSRAVRRQQAAAPKERPGRPPRIPSTRGPRPTRGAQAPRKEKRRFRLAAPGWVQDITSELRKVTWPTMAETRYLSMVVIVVAIAVGFALGVIDIFFNWFVDRLLLQ